jgi:hypothetical protein
MGAVTFSIDIGLVDHLRQLLPMSVFVETGTFHGDTLESIKDKFDAIYSVELSSEHYAKAVTRFSDAPHIDIALGDSAEALAAWAPKLSRSSVFYFLDAHWCAAENTAGQISQCPLLQEIGAIGHLNEQSVLVIDDARLFLAPPPEPHAVTQWPTLPELLDVMRQLAPAHLLMVLNDTFVLYPKALHQAMQRYARSAGMDWLALMSKQRDYDNLREQFDGLHHQFRKKVEELQKELDARLEVIQDLKDHWQRAEETCVARLQLIEQLESRQQLDADLLPNRAWHFLWKRK